MNATIGSRLYANYDANYVRPDGGQVVEDHHITFMRLWRMHRLLLAPHGVMNKMLFQSSFAP